MRQDDPKPRSKRVFTVTDIAAIAVNFQQYASGITTLWIGTYYGISKTRVAIILREQGVTRASPTPQVTEAATL